MDRMVLATQQWLNNTYDGIKGYERFSDKQLDGITGAGTFLRLIQALQIELNKNYHASLVVDGSFGKGTLNVLPDISPVSNSSSPSNLHYIVQGSLWCKGYDSVYFNGIYNSKCAEAVKEFQTDAGITPDGIIKPYILQGLMNTDGYKYTGNTGTDKHYKHLVQRGMNQYYGSKIGLTAPSGLWERKAHKNLIKSCQIEWGITGVDGIWGSGTMSKAPTLSKSTSGSTNSKRLLQWSLTVNGFYPGSFSGAFDTNTYNSVYSFQDFLCIGADGVAGKNTWASLLKSCGNTSRSASACDTATRLTPSTAQGLIKAGYDTVGRYLVNVAGGTLDKKITADEISAMANAGLKVFPIFQTIGNHVEYFTSSQGSKDAITAKTAARELGFPSNTTIYFAVDYDVLTVEVESSIIPYFSSLKANMGKAYKIGVYGPRMVCTALENKNLTASSFVGDMSSGFTGNIGQKMPSNWAYDQFNETTAAGIGIDKCVTSQRASAVLASSLSPYTDPKHPDIEQSFAIFEDLYNLVKDYFIEELSNVPTIYMANMRVLGYLRQIEYNSFAWTITAGLIDTTYNQYVAKHRPSYDCSKIAITDPGTNIVMTTPHLAATLQGIINYTIFIDQEMNACAGWAGDLLQIGSNLKVTNDQTGVNYFKQPDLLKKIIGDKKGELDEYNLYKYKNEKLKKGESLGFSWIDLCQDIDAYNMNNKYDIAEIPIHEILQTYYNKDWRKRFTTFKNLLLDEYHETSLSNIAYLYTKGDKAINIAFNKQFGGFDGTSYGRVLADAFETKINNLITME
ncbi:glycoside hydrolase domain-containing protein [Anaerosacchariphilus polymeriproducens]|nr:glycoside hydrolase domain-containing protein [Anaerosacchariphilus polymeriproducens]